MSNIIKSKDVSIEIQNRPFLPIEVNGKGPYRFLLDTGAHSSNLSLAVAKSVGARREEYPGWDQEDEYASIVELGFGGLKWKHVLYVSDFGGMWDYLSPVPGSPIDGMLSSLFLKDLKVTINYPEQTAVIKAGEGLDETLSPQELIKRR